MKLETRLQIDLVSWIRKTYPRLLFTSTQAGDRRSMLASMVMKRMGYTNGTPDILIFRSRGGYHGLFLELKVKGGKQSDSQLEFMVQARNEEYKYEVAWDLEEAKGIINDYVC